MSELGEVLKKARLEKKMSLEEIQDVTKIRKRYLEALESGDYNVLPGKFYIRAFIKNYAEAVGLDSEEVLKYYHDEVPAVETVVNEPIPARKPKRMRSASSEKFGKIGFTVLMWCFIGLIAFAIWYYFANKEADPVENGNGNGKQITDNSVAPKVTPTPTPVITPTPTPTVGPVSITFVEKNGRDNVFLVSPMKDTYSLKLTASGGASWIEVYEGGKNGTRLHYATMNDGEVLNFDVTKDVYISMRYAGYIEATLDGVVIEDEDIEKARILLKLDTADVEDTTTAE
ncbi:helix-turn-helix domain-containing protein [Paenibacillus endoradicis]|uniref:helix-turn-helix domain-containing protein n=1 Tax=Paenibacillus endoradicis TaxID=2972487 RepID=UPI002159AD8B|nr:helix-turn-helix domain-containing protein [Paenibacillus endoradicis]MCR8656326.1 helix-turn-helix domain-containing protein [Paenibacillus endoradicis]